MTHRVLWALALMVALGACSGLRKAAEVAPPYAVLPSVPESDLRAEAQPVVPTGDPALDVALADLAAALDRHDWRGVAMQFVPSTYSEQWILMVESGRSEEAAAVQVIAETLGFNAILGDYETLDTNPLARLDRLRVVTFRETHRLDSGGVHVTGDLRLEDGSRLPVDFILESTAGTYLVVVPMG